MKELSLLIASCDAYSDCWSPFFHFFEKSWPDCPYDIYLGTNHNEFLHSKVKTIKIGEDLSWASNIKKMLTEIDSEYVLLLFEDCFFFEFKVERILEAFENMKALKAKYLLLTPTPPPHIKLSQFPLMGEVQKFSRQRTPVGIGFWKVSTFLDLLVDGESAWDMEQNGSFRARELDGFYRVWKPLVKYHNAIIRGTWRRHAIKYCIKNGIKIDSTARPVFTIRETVWINIKTFIRRTIEKLPEPVHMGLFGLCRRTLNYFRKLFKYEVYSTS